MNYNTIVTPDAGIPCTPEEAAAIQALLRTAEEQDDTYHGFQFTVEDGLGYLQAEEVGQWSELPDAVLTAIGAVIARAGWPHWEFGAAYTASRLVPGSHGGTAFRIMADGRLVTRREDWP